jgi:toxin ParE1/3/4
MTGRYVVSRSAQRDIEKIWDYTEQRWGTDQAETYTRDLEAQIAALARRPAMGRPGPEIRQRYYKCRSGSHFVFYRLIADGINVVRILHERMDVARHL